MPHFAEMVYQLGGIPVMAGIPFGVNAKYYFVDPANGSDSNDGLSLEKAMASIPAAYTKCTANQHDTVFYIAGATSTRLSSALTWSKSYTHLIGITAPTMVGQRARIFQLSTATGLSPLIEFSGTACIIKNIYVFQGVDDATSLINIKVSGQRNYFENCNFIAGGNATCAVDGAVSLSVNDGDENTFVNCVFGCDTIGAGTGVSAINFDTTARRNIFRNCYFTLLAQHSGVTFVEVIDATGIDSFTIFDGCIFVNDQYGTTMSEAFKIPAGMTNATYAHIWLKDCAGYGFTDWEASNRNNLFMNMGQRTAGGNAGLFTVAATG